MQVDSFLPKWPFTNAHFNTIYTRFNKRANLVFKRTTFWLPDGDFLDLDFTENTIQTHVVVLIHGLEGSSKSGYIQGMAKALQSLNNITVCAINLRGCSGTNNLKLQSYHSGKTDDLHAVVTYLKNTFKQVSVVGFSLGGNLALKYAAEFPKSLHKVAAISAPIHLASSCHLIDKKWYNHLYKTRFLKQLKQKVWQKARQFPELGLSKKQIFSCRFLYDIDNIYTAPAHGFTNATDYYEQCSALYTLNKISCKVLIINPLDDPFLSKQCYPFDIISLKNNLKLLTPKYGGHVGFTEKFKQTTLLFSEKKVCEFIIEN